MLQGETLSSLRDRVPKSAVRFPESGDTRSWTTEASAEPHRLAGQAVQPGALRHEHVRAKSRQSCPTPCDAVDCSLPGSSVHGIF